ncbi:MAG: hypothetical protein SGJ20_19135 [Planctomycetota bacterium]|nr:hypothetical protein [Planctomycetota bacterium]
MAFEFYPPWHQVNDDGPHLEQELSRELSERHLLFGLKAKAIARRQDCDDVLFEISGASFRYAAVHLTWSGMAEAEPSWPYTKTFETLEDCLAFCADPDNSL